MKTLKLFFAVLVVFAGFTSAKAATTPSAVLPSQDYVVYTYINAMAHGNISGIDEVLDKNVKFNMVRGKNIISIGKNDILAYFKDIQNVSQNCTVTTSVVEGNADYTVVKVDMQYPDFVRSNYVTIANTANGWRITNVHSVFKS